MSSPSLQFGIELFFVFILDARGIEKSLLEKIVGRLIQGRFTTRHTQQMVKQIA
jgi:hypothetical protein